MLGALGVDFPEQLVLLKLLFDTHCWLFEIGGWEFCGGGFWFDGYWFEGYWLWGYWFDGGCGGVWGPDGMFGYWEPPIGDVV